MRIMAASGIMGYGFSEEAFRRGLDLGVEMVGCDAGSMDPGPYYLGTATPFVSAQAARRDLALMLEGAVHNKVPLIIGSAGGGGADPQLAWTRDMALEIAHEKDLSFRLATIGAEPTKAFLKAKTAAGKTAPLGPIADLTDETIDANARCVAMMGVEPLQAALDDGAEVIIAGRCSDAAIYAALPLMKGHDAGLAWHLGKIIECGAQVVEPRSGQDSIVGFLGDGYFEVEPGHPDKRCTRTRVAAHTLYENPSPSELKEPSGVLDSANAEFEQINERTVRVSGSRFRPADVYTVKLEGVQRMGFRSVFVAGVRDPILIPQFQEFTEACRERATNDLCAIGIDPNCFTLNFRIYGQHAVMGSRESAPDMAPPNELCVVADVIADTEENSRAVLAKVRYSLLHTDFPGRLCISGNLAFPFSPSDVSVGEVFDFNIWHTVELDDPLEPFTISIEDVT